MCHTSVIGSVDRCVCVIVYGCIWVFVCVVVCGMWLCAGEREKERESERERERVCVCVCARACDAFWCACGCIIERERKKYMRRSCVYKHVHVCVNVCM